MLVNIKRHLIYYISLLAILFLGVFFAFQVSYDKQIQVIIVMITALLYILFGLLHHLINHDLNKKIVIEYILMGALGISIILFIL